MLYCAVLRSVCSALQAMLESTVTVEASGERQQLARIVAAGGRFMMLAIKGPGRKAFLVAYPAMAEAFEAATGHEFPLNKAEVGCCVALCAGCAALACCFCWCLA